jgi:hypothetical protein
MSRSLAHRHMPDGVPELRAGTHLGPEDGACLMEYVSVLAGAPFSDRPKCTDPTLAELARLVNDASSDEGRARLADLAPALAASPRGRPPDAAAAVHAVLAVAYDATGGPAPLSRHLHRNGRRLRRVLGTGVFAALARTCDVLYRRGPGRRRMTAAVVALTRLSEGHRDGALRTALEAAVTDRRARRADDPGRPSVQRSNVEPVVLVPTAVG